MKHMIDFVIPCHQKDFPSLKLCVNGIKNISCRNKIYIISDQDPKIEGTIYISERKFDGFILKEDIKLIYSNKNPNLIYRSKWIYQQFLKLLCVNVIEDLTDSFVVVDSDTIFLRDVHFDSHLFFYSKAEEYHIPYLNPIKILLNTERTIGFSCINHHMIFNKEKIISMVNEIENRFNKEFSTIILEIIDYNEISSFSEWDLYANYMITNYSDICFQRQLNWIDIPFIPNTTALEQFAKDYDFVSCHAHKRGIE